MFSLWVSVERLGCYKRGSSNASWLTKRVILQGPQEILHVQRLFINADSGQMSAGERKSCWPAWQRDPNCLISEGCGLQPGCVMNSPVLASCLLQPSLIDTDSSRRNVHAYIRLITPIGPGLSSGHTRECVVCISVCPSDICGSLWVFKSSNYFTPVVV